MNTIDLSVNLPGLSMKNPVMPASGCFGIEYTDVYDPSVLGGVVLKSVTKNSRFGCPLPRIAETASGMLSCIGLQNPGVDQMMQTELPEISQLHLPVVANIAGEDISEYLQVIEKLNESNAISAYEINTSCPNAKQGGIAFGVDPHATAELTKQVVKASKRPVYIKLSPNVTDIVEIAKAAESAGADGLVLINTLTGMKIDLRRGTPLLGNGTGGLSGPAIKPIALRMVYQVYEAVSIPIIGVGGITSASDVLEFFYAGASAVQVGMYNFVDLHACERIIQELPEVCAQYGWDRLQDAVGKSHQKTLQK